MTSKIDAKEVLIYLNQLGYKNVDATQLKNFIKDLKKLIKYQERISSSQKENILTDKNFKFDSTCNESEYDIISTVALARPVTVCCISSESTSTTSNTISDIPTNYNKKTTVYSVETKNKNINKKNYSTVSPGSTKPKGIGCPENSKQKTLLSDCICPIDASNKVGHSCISEKSKTDGRKRYCSTIASTDSQTVVTKSCPSKTGVKKFVHPCYCPGSLKPRSAVIKTNIGCKPAFQKCDPVALHNYYQQQWKIQNIPGENPSKEQRFRWCLREKISHGPSVKVKKGTKKKFDIVL